MLYYVTRFKITEYQENGIYHFIYSRFPQAQQVCFKKHNKGLLISILSDLLRNLFARLLKESILY